MTHAASVRPILDVARSLDLDPAQVIPYGRDKAKITLDALASGRPPGRLVLVSAITPTDAGEGKTTTSIGLAQGFARLGQRVCLALREPSLGPTFGQKGGATGGGAGARRARERHQPALHRRLPRHRLGAQPAGGDARQPHPPRQRPGHRSAARDVAARHRHERPVAAPRGDRPGRRARRRAARDRVRHHAGVRGDGRAVPRRRATTTCAAGSRASSWRSRPSARPSPPPTCAPWAP